MKPETALALVIAPLPTVGLFTINMPLMLFGLAGCIIILVWSLNQPSELELAEQAYYNDGEPVMDDDDYDKLKRDSAVETVGAPVIGGLTHATRMLSLRNAIDEDELRDFFDDIKIAVGAASFIVEPKIDGLALNATYSGGMLVSAVTRGDGDSGQDVTENMRHILPEKINIKEAEIRGEVYLSKANLEAINEVRISRNMDAYKTCQSAAVATLLHESSDMCKARKIAFVAYDIGYGKDANTQSALCNSILKSFGFSILPHSKVRTFEGMLRASKRMFSECKLPCDGAVIKLDDIAGQVAMGATKTAPNYAIAWKGCKE